ncbi:MAG TPA: aspartyl protease family protein [Stellaceae bacterium]|nr:aspartyl protease family protein [Stellaceae bacterium]
MSDVGRPAPELGAPAQTGRSSEFRVISGSEAVVPTSIEAGAVIVNVVVNGRGPFPMMFDTGAQDAVTPETAAALGLKAEGSGSVRDSGGNSIPVTYAKVRNLRLGNVEMADQPFAIVPLPRYLTDRGGRPPLAGVIGNELLAHFAVRLDYEGRTLTLRPAQGFDDHGNGTKVPLRLRGKAPAVSAAADGIPGVFVLDTGSVGALTLRREFVEKHGLEARHPSALRVKSISAAGPFEAILTRLDRFDVAGSRIDRPAARFPSTTGKGLVFTDIDGSIGYEILRQFTITFDYERRNLWFEHSGAFGTRTGQGSAGFQAVKSEGAGFKVITVLPNTAAAEAGVRVGDVIVAIDGRSTASMSLSDFAVLMRRPPGTLVNFDIDRDGNRQSVSLTLKDVLP